MSDQTTPAGPDDDADDDQPVLTFDDGLPGFPEARHFLLVNEVEDAAFQLLQCLELPDVAFVVTVPWLFFPEYSPEISEHEAAELDIEDPSTAVVFCPVTLDADQDRITLNLLGPFVVNPETRRGRQVVLTEQDLDVAAEIPLSALRDIGDVNGAGAA